MRQRGIWPAATLVILLALGCGGGGGGGGGGPAAVAVISSDPANGANGVANAATIVITFNQAMSTASVQAAFNVAPATPGAFAWDAASKILTFVPNSTLTGNTSYTVTIGTGATGAAGGTLAAPFSVTFTTLDNTKLQGATTDPANTHIPDVEFPDPPAADLVSAGGVQVSDRDLEVAFADTATVGDVNTLIQSLPAEIDGGDPNGKDLLLRLTGASTLSRVLAAQATLLSSPLVVGASINFQMGSDQLPPHNVDPTNNRWTWEFPWIHGTGNWGLKDIRMPQAWNLYDYAVRQNQNLQVAVLEARRPDNAIDATHEDFAPGSINFLATSNPSDHATMVGGIIGAVWNNQKGVEGAYPRTVTLISRPATFAGKLQDRVVRLLNTFPNLRVINYSVGMSATYQQNNIDPVTAPVDSTSPEGPNNPTWQDEMDHRGVLLLHAIQGLGNRDFLMFCSAGNLYTRPGTNFDYSAADNSACANVARRGVGDPTLPLNGAGADHFLAVEASDPNENRAPFSAAFGNISAPGVCIRSTQSPGGGDFNSPACWATSTTDPNYATSFGTSFATPFASALAAYLWSLNWNLTYGQVRSALSAQDSTVPVGPGSGGGQNGAPRIDAFTAAMKIDTILNNKALETALVDVDDGTLDGNQRTVRDDSGNVTSDFAAIATSDGRRGDGKIDMADFRAYRDALIEGQIEDGDLNPALADLDGAANNPKKDLNEDACVGDLAIPGGPATCGAPDTVNENVYPRFDFNGDGRVDYNPVGGTSGFLPFKGHNWAGYQVLQDVWPADSTLTEGWRASDLFSLLPSSVTGSGDVEFRTNLTLCGACTYDEIRITIQQPAGAITRSLTALNNRLIWTLPVGAPTSASADGYHNQIVVNALCFQQAGQFVSQIPALKHGQDLVALVVACPTGGPSVDWSGSTVTRAQTTYFNVDSSGNRIGSQQQLASSPPLEQQNDSPSCAPLSIGQTCTFQKNVSFNYSIYTFTVNVSRTAAQVYEVTGSLSGSPAQPPLLAPPAPSNTFCGDTRPNAATECYSSENGGLDVEIHVPIQIPGVHAIKYECTASGQATYHPQTGQGSYTRLLMSTSAGGPVTGCDSPDPAQSNWSVSNNFTGSDDTTATAANFGISANLAAYLEQSYLPAHQINYSDPVQLTLTMMRITIQ